VALTSRFLFDFESNLVNLIEESYVGLSANLWWTNVARTRTTKTRKEIFSWLLSTAQIHEEGAEAGGILRYGESFMVQLSAVPKFASAAFRIGKNELEDLDANGIEAASQWARDIGAYMAYWPQKKVTHLLKNGHTASAYPTYDDLALFSGSHLLNPKNANVGTYSNLYTSVDISTAVSAETALQNLTTVFSNVMSIKQANGEDPRNLKPKGILCGPKLFPRVAQLTNAKFLAQAAGSAAGTADVEALIAALGFGQPIMAPELAGFESDTTYFVLIEDLKASQLGPAVYVEREPFSMITYTGQDGRNADLGRGRELEWQVQGRNTIIAGHPYLIAKCTA
jgi:hypothetical protein